ncbi:recombinase family protein [Prosthecochloris sp. SCSIO W1101]|uniref:recombinase family protein n=1 Tax=Prosthecochloris sp. SCSIO W1101 TaxID=2992242 RepID=UPI0039FD336E
MRRQTQKDSITVIGHHAKVSGRVMPSSEMVFNIFVVLAQFERRLIQERTQAGLKAARARGKNGDRPKISPDDEKVQMAKKMSQNHTISVGEICKTLGISRGTYYRYLEV